MGARDSYTEGRGIVSGELFDEPPTEELELSGLYRDHANVQGVYAAYPHRTHVACDECIAYLHVNRGQGPVPRSAKVTRKPKAKDVPALIQRTGVGSLRLCAAHRDLWFGLDSTKGRHRRV
jgi:hypothetical protein